MYWSFFGRDGVTEQNVFLLAYKLFSTRLTLSTLLDRVNSFTAVAAIVIKDRIKQTLNLESRLFSFSTFPPSTPRPRGT